MQKSMHLVFIILVVCSFVFFQNKVCAQKKLITKKYFATGGYAGCVLAFNADSAFTYRYRGHAYSDTAAGKYNIKNDTVFLKYSYNDYEAIFASYKANNEAVPPGILFSARNLILRPRKLVIKGKNLFVVDDATGQLKTYVKKGREKKVIYKRYK